MSPSVNFGDSGELIASAATLSVSHAPGYPLMSLLGHALGILLPVATWAYRINLLSVLCGAFAIAVIFDAFRRAGIRSSAAAAGVSLLGFSPLWLHTSLQTEVFALNSLCAAGVLWVYCAYWRRLYDPRPSAALGLCLGLAGANHHTLILIVPAVLIGGWLSQRPDREKTICGLMRVLGFGLAGLVVYAYLPIRANALPPLDWGHPNTWERFVHVLLRRDYGSFSLTVEGASGGRIQGVLPQSVRYFGELWKGFGPAGCALALWGAWSWSTRRSDDGPSWHCAALWFFVSGPFFLFLGNPPFDAQTGGALERFYLLGWIAVAWFAAQGASALLRSGPNWRGGVFALILIPFFSASLSAARWGQRWDLAAHDYGENVFRSLPRGSAFFIDGGDDTFYTAAYNLYARKRRADLAVHDRGGLVFESVYGDDFRSLTPAEKEKRRVSVESSYARRMPTFYSTLRPSVLDGKPLGFWGLVRRADSSAGFPDIWRFYISRHSKIRAQSHYRYRALVPIYPILRSEEDLAAGRLSRALIRLGEALGVGRDVRWVRDVAAKRSEWIGFNASKSKDWALAEAAYAFSLTAKDSLSVILNLGVTREKQENWAGAEAAYKIALDNFPESFQTFYNLGTLYWKTKRFEESARMFERASGMDAADDGARIFAQRARSMAAKK
jgi:tetratricopeptide (TPR) repeat protein